MSQFHAVGGQYDPLEQWVGLDYATAFMREPIYIEGIIAHEFSHAVIAATDYGQASFVIFALVGEFNHVTADEANAMERAIFYSQDFVQEGLSTLMQASRLRFLSTKRHAKEWVHIHSPKYYTDMFQRLDFVMDMSKSYRDLFMMTSHMLAMTNGFRQNAARMDLLKDRETLEEYLADPDNDPNLRLDRIVEAARKHHWLVTRPIEEICEISGITFYETATKEEVANFQTYVASHTETPHIFLPSDIGDPAVGDATLQKARDNLLVTNLNLGLAENGELLNSVAEFLHYADVITTIFVSYHDTSWKPRAAVRQLIGEDPDVALIAFTKTGEKYFVYCSKSTAAGIINNELQETTLVVKWGGYSASDNRFIWSSTARPPDVVLYNSPPDMYLTFKEVIDANESIEFRHLHVGATENHPLHNLFVIKEGVPVIHMVSDFGGVRIAEVVALLGQRSSVLSHGDLRRLKVHINNALVLFGLLRSIDWVETMIAQTLVMRTD